MTRRARLEGSAAAATVAASAISAARAPLGNDYPNGGPGLDGAGPQIDALIHGDLHRFFEVQSSLGRVWLVARALFAVVSRIGDATLLTQYRLGVFPCVAALALAALLLTLPALRDPIRAWHPVALVALLLIGPPSVNAIRSGHPEELLTTALVLAAVWAATRPDPRRAAAAILLGLAIACKPWAVIAVAPVAAAFIRPAALRASLIAVVVGGVLIAPMALANSGAFHDAARGAN